MSKVTKPVLLNETGVQQNAILTELVAVQKAAVLAGSNMAAIDHLYGELVRAATAVKEVDALFVEWWKANWREGETTRNELLERWFGAVLDDERVHGVKFPLFATSQTAIGELTDDSVGLVCTPSTAANANRDDFAYLPQFWCLEVSAEKAADGSHTIYAVEHIDSYSEIRSGKHLCWVLQKNTFTKEWDEGGYRHFQMRCHPALGFDTWPQGTDRKGVVHAYIGNPKYYAGLDSTGKITCGTGLAPINFSSHNENVIKWRGRGAQYSGASGNLLKWQLAMIWLKYARKGNSGTIEGCSSYYHDYKAAVSEEGVERIILTAAQAANLLVGSTVNIGTGRNNEGVKLVKITSIDDVEIGGTAYKAVNVDNRGVVFNTTAGTTVICTMPYHSGWNDMVQGFDGSRHSPTSGKEPGLIQKTEFQNGAYIIVSDELWQWGQNGAGDYILDCYTCHDQSKVTTNGTISADYALQNDLRLTFPAGTTSGWRYIEDTAIAKDRAVSWPAGVSTAAGGGTGCKAGFYVGVATSGVRAAWCCSHLNRGGLAGLPARYSVNTVTDGYWSGCAGSPGLAG